MGWIKAELDDNTHKQIKAQAQDSGKPIHEYVGELLRECIEADQ